MNTDMTIAMTVWGNRISPVFDSSNTLMIAKVCQSAVIERTHKSFDPRAIKQMASFLSNFGAGVLICGAIMDSQSEAIIKQGIRLVPFITGDALQILDAYICKPKQILNYLMPGTHLETSLNPH